MAKRNPALLFRTARATQTRLHLFVASTNPTDRFLVSVSRLRSYTAKVLAKGILSIDDDGWSTDDVALPQELLGVCTLPTMGCLRTVAVWAQL